MATFRAMFIGIGVRMIVLRPTVSRSCRGSGRKMGMWIHEDLVLESLNLSTIGRSIGKERQADVRANLRDRVWA
jgi:hypothetical protein